MKTLSDRELISLCCRKDRSAWSLFISRFSRLILWAIRDRLKRWNYSFSDRDVEDIYQEILISFWERDRLAQIRERDRIVSWLIVVSGNSAVDYFRRGKDPSVRTVVSIFEKLNPYSVENLALKDVLGSSAGNPGRVLAQKELKLIVEGVIESLSPGHRSVVTLSFLYGKRQREIAEMLKLPVNTVSTIIRRTRKRLRQELAKKGYENF